MGNKRIKIEEIYVVTGNIGSHILKIENFCFTQIVRRTNGALKLKDNLAKKKFCGMTLQKTDNFTNNHNGAKKRSYF